MPTSPARIFSDEFRHALDNKNRLTIPARWRQGESDEFFIIPHRSNDYLTVMPPEEFQQVSETVATKAGVSLQKQQAFIRDFYRRAKNVWSDRQGRLLLAEEHCKLLQLKGEVVLVGSHTRFEIWHPGKWAEFQKNNAETYNEVAELVGL